jgi:hypothetical protein
VGRNFEVQRMTVMPRANTRGDDARAIDTAAPGSGNGRAPSTGKEAPRKGRRRRTGETLKRAYPETTSALLVRATDQEGAAGRPCAGRERPERAWEGTAMVANEVYLRGSGGGSCVSGMSSAREDREIAPDWLANVVDGEPQERCLWLVRAGGQAERGAKRQRRANVKGAMGRGWLPGADRKIRTLRSEGAR